MSIFSKIRENAKSFKAAKQKQKQPTATAEKQKPELEKQKDDAQPQLQSGAIPTVAIQEAQEDDPQVQPEGKRASWRPAMNRTKSNESLKRLSAPALRNSTSAPNLRTLKHRSSDLSIESVMLSLDFPMPATTKKPTETMTLKSRNSLVAPNQFTYDPTKTPAFVGRKKGRPRRLHPSSRSSSFIRLQQIEPMAEENEGKSNTQRKVSMDDSLTQSLQMARPSTARPRRPNRARAARRHALSISKRSAQSSRLRAPSPTPPAAAAATTPRAAHRGPTLTAAAAAPPLPSQTSPSRRPSAKASPSSCPSCRCRSPLPTLPSPRPFPRCPQCTTTRTLTLTLQSSASWKTTRRRRRPSARRPPRRCRRDPPFRCARSARGSARSTIRAPSPFSRSTHPSISLSLLLCCVIQARVHIPLFFPPHYYFKNFHSGLIPHCTSFSFVLFSTAAAAVTASLRALLIWSGLV
ncbi:hypothetical protein JOL62DRAFT_88231 [Phyllosticta paracitricarpa]|uniref:Uncharacterized protein n=1 Tax=Phyllosticta paracitricarpa TaxID=2016321 RepID=A0ABR1N775_9PEZI